MSFQQQQEAFDRAAGYVRALVEQGVDPQTAGAHALHRFGVAPYKLNKLIEAAGSSGAGQTHVACVAERA